MDEPFASLDQHLRDRLREEVRQIQRKLKITTVFVTHGQDEALSIADRIVVMSTGPIEQVGNPLRFTAATADADYDLSPVTICDQDVRIHALKPAEDGDGYVLRFSEAVGRRGSFAICVPDGRTCRATNALEAELEDMPSTLKPFGLVSVRF